MALDKVDMAIVERRIDRVAEALDTSNILATSTLFL